MMYPMPDGELRNLDKILRVAKLEDCFRFGYRKYDEVPPKKKFFGLWTTKGSPAGYYLLDWLDSPPKLVTREEAIYDGKFIRIWSNPQNVEYWNCGQDLEFPSVEEANKFYDACMNSTGCKFDG